MVDVSQLLFYAFKYLITALLIVAVSETAKRSDRLGGLLAALPIVTVSTLLWLQVEHQPYDIIRDHAMYTLYYVIPTLPMFLAFPFLYEKYSFASSLMISCVITVISFIGFALMIYPFGVHLIGASQ